MKNFRTFKIKIGVLLSQLKTFVSFKKISLFFWIIIINKHLYYTNEHKNLPNLHSIFVINTLLIYIGGTRQTCHPLIYNADRHKYKSREAEKQIYSN